MKLIPPQGQIVLLRDIVQNLKMSSTQILCGTNLRYFACDIIYQVSSIMVPDDKLALPQGWIV